MEGTIRLIKFMYTPKKKKDCYSIFIDLGPEDKNTELSASKQYLQHYYTTHRKYFIIPQIAAQRIERMKCLAYQVFKKCSQFLSEDREFQESRPQVRVISADTIASEFFQCLCILFFILNVG